MDIPLKNPRNTFRRRLKRYVLTVVGLFALVLGIGALPVVVIYIWAQGSEPPKKASIQTDQPLNISINEAVPSTPPVALSDATTAFINVNVIPMDSEQILTRQTVIVRDGRISEIGPAGQIEIPHGASRIEGRGRYLLPGFADMHIHFRGGSIENNAFLQLFVANGVTTALNLYGTPEHLKLREMIAKGELLGPVMYTSGPFVNEPIVTTPEEVERAVIEQKRMGYDFIKMHGELSREAYRHLFVVARREGIRVIGHAPRKLGMKVLLEERQEAIAHAEEYLYAYFGFDRKYPEDSEEIASMVRHISQETAKSGTWVIPTLAVYKGIGNQVEDVSASLARPEVKYMPPQVMRDWVPSNNTYVRRFKKEYVPVFRSRYGLLEKLVKGLSDAGVPMLAGTDTPVPSVVPGFSMHDELKDLVAAGLTPYQALRTATINAAEFLGALDSTGTVSVGKRADLILIEANPLEDIANTSRLNGVMVRGRWLAKDDLRAMLDRLRNSYFEQ